MKKLLKLFAVPAILACGLFVGCNNEGMDLDLNPVVSTEVPSLSDPTNLGYGVLLTWRCTQDGSSFKVTRQEKDGEEKVLEDGVSENRYIDAASILNPLEAGVEYTYRVYNLGDKGNVVNSANSDSYGGEAFGANYGTNYIVKDSYAEKRITLAAESLKAKGAKLDADKKENVVCSFKNSYLTIYFQNDENHQGSRKIEITDVDTGRKVSGDNNIIWSNRWSSSGKLSADKITVAITNVWNDDYYEESDPLKIENIENVVDPDSVDVQDLTASVRDNTVVLLWTSSNEDAVAGDFTIQRLESNSNSAKYETLKITATLGTKYDGTKYWTAADSTIEVGKYYIYKVVTDDIDGYASVVVSVPGFIEITKAVYDKTKNTVTLQWNANNISDFIIYRAEGKLSGENYGGLNEDEYYDLFKALEITSTKLYDTIDEYKEPLSVYTAIDTVEKNKDYTYMVTSKSDGLSVCSRWNYTASTMPDTYIYGVQFLDENGDELSQVYDNYQFSGNEDDKITLQFYGNSDVTYKGFWTTGDKNYEIESEAHSFEFSKDNSDSYKKEFKASAFGVSSYGTVNFYVQVLVDGELVNSASKSVSFR